MESTYGYRFAMLQGKILTRFKLLRLKFNFKISISFEYFSHHRLC